MTLITNILINAIPALIIIISILIGMEDRATKSSIKVLGSIGNAAISLLLGRLISSYIVFQYDLTFAIVAVLFVLFNILLSVILTTNRNIRYSRRLKREVKTEVRQSRNKAVRDMRAKNKEIKRDKRAYRQNRKTYFRSQRARTSKTFGGILGFINGAIIAFVLLVTVHLSLKPFNIDIYNKVWDLSKVVTIEQVEEIIEKV